MLSREGSSRSTTPGPFPSLAIWSAIEHLVVQWVKTPKAPRGSSAPRAADPYTVARLQDLLGAVQAIQPCQATVESPTHRFECKATRGRARAHRLAAFHGPIPRHAQEMPPADSSLLRSGVRPVGLSADIHRYYGTIGNPVTIPIPPGSMMTRVFAQPRMPPPKNRTGSPARVLFEVTR